jgi:hypothetical protein
MFYGSSYTILDFDNETSLYYHHNKLYTQIKHVLQSFMMLS